MKEFEHHNKKTRLYYQTDRKKTIIKAYLSWLGWEASDKVFQMPETNYDALRIKISRPNVQIEAF